MQTLSVPWTKLNRSETLINGPTNRAPPSSNLRSTTRHLHVSVLYSFNPTPWAHGITMVWSVRWVVSQQILRQPRRHQNRVCKDAFPVSIGPQKQPLHLANERVNTFWTPWILLNKTIKLPVLHQGFWLDSMKLCALELICCSFLL